MFEYDANALERAVSHSEDFWFPVNEKALTRIQRGLAEGAYDTSSLVRDIQDDFSLFAYCLRHLKSILGELNAGKFEENDPVALLESAGLDALKTLLDKPSHLFSRHTTASINDLQSRRLAEAVTSAATAEALAAGMNVSPSTGYTTALLRQLGYALISWNYPSVYRSAIASMNRGEDLDLSIGRRLGFSPSMLAVQVIERWEIFNNCAEIFSDVDGNSAKGNVTTSVTMRNLARLCRASEALARANQPDLYPKAQSDWLYATNEIAKTLGESGMALISQAIRKRAADYEGMLQNSFIVSIEERFSAANAASGHHLDLQQCIAQCSPHIGQQLELLTSRLHSNTVSAENLNTLLKQIVPLAEFTSGCVFTADPASEHLLPQFRIGSLRLRDFTPVPFGNDSLGKDLVARAFRALEPVQASTTATNGIAFISLAGPLGAGHSTYGVLYLEMLKSTFDTDPAQHLRHFHAFSRTLAACLNLE